MLEDPNELIPETQSSPRQKLQICSKIIRIWYGILEASMSKRRSNKKLEDTARQVADRLDRVREWMEGVADPNSKTFYSSELISGEQLLSLRDILGALPGADEVEAPPTAPPISDDDDWEDIPED
jgi:hypothetical protein